MKEFDILTLIGCIGGIVCTVWSVTLGLYLRKKSNQKDQTQFQNPVNNNCNMEQNENLEKYENLKKELRLDFERFGKDWLQRRIKNLEDQDAILSNKGYGPGKEAEWELEILNELDEALATDHKFEKAKEFVNKSIANYKSFILTPEGESALRVLNSIKTHFELLEKDNQ